MTEPSTAATPVTGSTYLGINVTVSGPGSVVAGKIDCSALSRSSACTEAFQYGTEVHLNAKPARTARLRTWSGELCPHSRALTCSVRAVSPFTGEAVFGKRR